MTAKEIREAKPEGKFALAAHGVIEFDNGVKFETGSHREQVKLQKKLYRMGYVIRRNFSSDEYTGLAAAKPEEVFNFKIIEG